MKVETRYNPAHDETSILITAHTVEAADLGKKALEAAFPLVVRALADTIIAQVVPTQLATPEQIVAHLGAGFGPAVMEDVAAHVNAARAAAGASRVPASAGLTTADAIVTNEDLDGDLPPGLYIIGIVPASVDDPPLHVASSNPLALTPLLRRLENAKGVQVQLGRVRLPAPFDATIASDAELTVRPDGMQVIRQWGDHIPDIVAPTVSETSETSGPTLAAEIVAFLTELPTQDLTALHEQARMAHRYLVCAAITAEKNRRWESVKPTSSTPCAK